MKKAWNDLKSFVTIWLMILLAVVVIGDLFGYKLDQDILLLFTNIITSVITYYFTRKKNKDDEDKEDVI
jgi:uncharacterized membrane protein YfcA